MQLAQETASLSSLYNEKKRRETLSCISMEVDDSQKKSNHSLQIVYPPTQAQVYHVNV